MAVKTNCPNCGAPIDYSKANCAYCCTPYFQQTNFESKSAPPIAHEELGDQLIGESAEETLDTLNEIIEWIKKH